MRRAVTQPAAMVGRVGLRIAEPVAERMSMAPHRTPEVPPALAGPLLTGCGQHRALPAALVDGVAAASRAADEPLTMPRP